MVGLVYLPVSTRTDVLNKGVIIDHFDHFYLINLNSKLIDYIK